MTDSIWSQAKIFYSELSQKAKRDLLLLQVFIIISSFFEVAGVLSIMPFILDYSSNELQFSKVRKLFSEKKMITFF